MFQEASAEQLEVDSCALSSWFWVVTELQSLGLAVKSLSVLLLFIGYEMSYF